MFGVQINWIENSKSFVAFDFRFGLPTKSGEYTFFGLGVWQEELLQEVSKAKEKAL